VRANVAQATADVGALRQGRAGDPELQRIVLLAEVFRSQLDIEQRLIAAHRLAQAGNEVLTVTMRATIFRSRLPVILAVLLGHDPQTRPSTVIVRGP